MTLTIEPHAYDAMLRAARRAAPLEACGLCGGKDGRVTQFYELTNVDASTDHFTMKPEEQFAAIKDMRAKGLRMLAIWHSHPASPARMSQEDLRLAYTPDVVYLILSLAKLDEPDLRGYAIENGSPVPIGVAVGSDSGCAGDGRVDQRERVGRQTGTEMNRTRNVVNRKRREGTNMSRKAVMQVGVVVATVAIGLCGVNQAYGDEVAARLKALEKRVAELDTQGKRGELNGVSLGGYGELHYNNVSGKGGAADKKEIDFHRFVLFLGHEFTDRIRFNSELELEHSLAGESKPGEVELEQAYVDFDLDDRHTARAGLFLVPVGLLNSTHEPPRFYGVERPAVESAILPTTWWEAGAGLHGELGAGFKYEAYVHSGLGTSTGSTYAVRSGRKKVASAPASDPAATLALNWSIPGVTLGGAVNYQSVITQGADPNAGEAWLGEVHADLRRGPFGLRALYAEWSLDGEGPKRMDADRQVGWYVEPSYRVTEAVGVFVRYNEWDNQAGSSDTASRKRQWDAGVNWWPHEQVVVKADYQWQDNENGKDQNGVNLGIGYEF